MYKIEKNILINSKQCVSFNQIEIQLFETVTPRFNNNIWYYPDNLKPSVRLVNAIGIVSGL